MDFMQPPEGMMLPPAKSPTSELERESFLGKDFQQIMHSLGGVGLLKKLHAAEQMKNATAEEERATFQADVKKRELPRARAMNA